MPRSVTFKVHGLRELGEAMRELDRAVALRIAGSMTNAAAQVVKREAVRNIVSSPSVDTGSLKESVIVKKIPKSRTRLTSEHIVTVRRGRGTLIKRGKKKGQRQTTAPHGQFVEVGTVNMEAEPFLKPALEREKEKAAEAMRLKGLQRIENEARKARKR
jgi:HK97 gp10 family phage protein